MGRPYIRLGDSTSHGGTVISATARMTIDGIPVARLGDQCTCPIPYHYNCVIVEGDMNNVFDGIPVALEGHKTSCGATLIPSQVTRAHASPLGSGAGGGAGAGSGGASTGGGAGAGSGSASAAGSLSAPGASATTGGSSSAAGGPTSASSSADSQTKSAFDRKFQLTDFEDGTIHVNQKYRITTSQGVFEGVTDSQGLTQNVGTGESEGDMDIALIGD